MVTSSLAFPDGGNEPVEAKKGESAGEPQPLLPDRNPGFSSEQMMPVHVKSVVNKSNSVDEMRVLRSHGLHAGSTPSDALENTSDFIQKLYRMLDEESGLGIVLWGSEDDTLIIRDVSEFSKTVMPRHFKHNNFASFIRQLNKYDFHKLKNADPDSGVWEFKHPRFQRYKPEFLGRIKRKVPVGRKTSRSQLSLHPTLTDRSTVSNALPNYLPKDNESLYRRTIPNAPGQSNKHESASMQDLKLILDQVLVEYHSLVEQIHKISAQVTAQENLLKRLLENAPKGDVGDHSSIKPYTNIRASDNTFYSGGSKAVGNEFASFAMPQSWHNARSSDFGSSHETHSVSYPLASLKYPSDYFPSSSHHGILPYSHPSNRNSAHATAQQWAHTFADSYSGNHTASLPQFSNSPKSGVNSNLSHSTANDTVVNDSMSSKGKRAWTTPPKVLLIENDENNRKFSQSCLLEFGCICDVAMDAREALYSTKIIHYDMVLLNWTIGPVDGVAASSAIRQMNNTVPIILMTQCINEKDSQYLLSTGINGILTMPFTKDTLLTVVERVCGHL